VSEYALYTDGSGITNPKRCGWGFILVGPDHTIKGQGWQYGLATNRMELIAIIKGLEAIPLDRVHTVTVYTDSLYVTTGCKAKPKSFRRPEPLWVRYHELCSKHLVRLVRVGSGTGLRPAFHKQAHDLAREAVFYGVSTEALSQDVSSIIFPGFIK
jgi:ribonuclease HI